MARMEKKHKLMLIVVLVLVGAYGWQYRGALSSSSSSFAELQAQLAAKELTLKRALADKKLTDEKIKIMQRNGELFYSSSGSGSGALTLTLRKKLDGIYRSIYPGRTLPLAGKPGVTSVSSELESVNVPFQAKFSMKDFALFMQKIDEARPHLFVQSCTLKPDNQDSPQFYEVRCNIEALALKSKATKLLEAKSE